MIEFKNVSVWYKLYHERQFTFKELVLNLLKEKKDIAENFLALDDLSFLVKCGETIGIIGENGSGKSTILKLIAKVFEPTNGKINIDGRISALIELGAGFNLELTGTENIFLNGAILGLSKNQMKKKFNQIVEFAELEHFIDIPVKYYSSGMYMRLGFAIAVEVDADILLIDEILAVGDETFQGKCFRKIEEFKKLGKTIVFVSHDMSAIEKLCDRIIVLHHGKIINDGKPTYAIERYHRLLYNKISKVEATTTNRWGNYEIEIREVVFKNRERMVDNVFKTGDTFIAQIKYFANKKITFPVFGIAIYHENGLHINGPNTKFSHYPIELVEGEGTIEYIIESIPLLKGEYLFSAVVYDESCLIAYDHQEKMYKFRIIPGGTEEKHGILEIPSKWRHN